MTSIPEAISPVATKSAPHQEPLLSTPAMKPTKRGYLREKLRRKGTRKVAWSSWWWWWEIGGAFLALTCLFLTIAVLKVLDGTPVNDWKYNIQPSSLLSTLNTVGKTGMTVVLGFCVSQVKWSHFEKPNLLSHFDTIDQVSRAGPWSTAKMFLKMRATLLKQGSGLLITLLALVTLGSIAIDPMIQQILDARQGDLQPHNITSYIAINNN